MLVGLEHRPEHLTGFEAGLVDEVITDAQQLWECHLDNLVKVAARLAHLEPIHPADGQQTLQTCKDGSGILCVEEADGDVEEIGPLLGEVVVQDLLESCDELCADLRCRGGDDWHQPIADRGLFLFWHTASAAVLLIG